MFDLITIGDTVIDTFVSLEDAEVDIAKGEKMLLLRAGDKIPVGPSVSVIGGNSANAAVGGSRLKLKVATYTNIGNEVDDHRILNTFKTEGVDIRYVVKNNEPFSNNHIVLDYKGERTILVYHQPWKYELPDLDLAKWVYFSSLAPSFVHSSIISQVTNYLERVHAKLLFNPGTFLIKHGVKKYPRLLSLAEIFIVNKEEAKLVLGYEESEKISPKKLLKELSGLGPRFIVITSGLEGSFGFDGEKYWELKSFPAKTVEPTGAGDAYATGVLGALFHGKELSEAMRWGAANGASVVEKIGPQAGLLTYHGMEEKLKECSQISAKEM